MKILTKIQAQPNEIYYISILGKQTRVLFYIFMK